MPRQIKKMFYRGRLLNPRRQGVGRLEIEEEDFPELLAAAREDLKARRAERAARNPRPRAKRTAAQPFTATEIKNAKRRKHNCWSRRMKFIEMLFVRYGSGEYRDDAPTVREAARKAGLGSYWAAEKIVYYYR